MKEFKGVWIQKEILKDKNLNDKEKITYSMILYLSAEKDCTISNAYIGEILNICNIQVSRIINSLKKKGYIKTEIVYRENSKEILIRKCIPINIYVNTYKQISALPINKNVKDIKSNNKINNINTRLKNENQRDYSKFDFSKLYANEF